MLREWAGGNIVRGERGPAVEKSWLRTAIDGEPALTSGDGRWSLLGLQLSRFKVLVGEDQRQIGVCV